MSFSRSSQRKYTKKELMQAYHDERAYLHEYYDSVKTLYPLLLDSRLITKSLYTSFDTKIVKCGKYIQVYKYQKTLTKKKSGYEKLKSDSRVVYDILNTDTDDLEYLEEKEEKKKMKKENNLKRIDEKNIKRSKFQLQRIIKSNEEIFKTFITLTFANFEKVKIDKKDIYYFLCPNVQIDFEYKLCYFNSFVCIKDKKEFNNNLENFTSISKANRTFNIWRSNLKKRLKNDFKYVCVPEFQKNGTVHYHLLTNINYNDILLLSKDEKKIYKRGKGWQIFKTVNSWRYGFSNCIDIKDFNVVAYLTKYMTKDIDNRLFGRRRYLYSQDLNKPSVVYYNSELDTKDLLNKVLGFNHDEVFNNFYADKNGLVINFSEYRELEELDINEVLCG